MIPISDPFSDGHKTDQYAFGSGKASSMTWWHDDATLSPGQVRIGDQVLTLGANKSQVLETNYSEKSVLKEVNGGMASLQYT